MNPNWKLVPYCHEPELEAGTLLPRTEANTLLSRNPTNPRIQTDQDEITELAPHCYEPEPAKLATYCYEPEHRTQKLAPYCHEPELEAGISLP